MWHVISELFIICLIYYSTAASESHTDSDSECERTTDRSTGSFA